MRFKWIKLVGYAGIKGGMLRDEITIDFTQSKSRIVTIIGDNGSGKSTLLTALSVIPDDNSMFLPCYAEKSGCIIDNDIEYNFICQHPVRERVNKVTNEIEVERLTTKAYIQKSTPNGFLELNPVGTVGSYKDVLDAEFKLDANFIALSSLSTEDKGLVDKTPSNRKKFVNAIVEQVAVFNNINKALVKRNAINKSMMNNLLSKIETVGDEENLNLTLNNIENKLNILNGKRDILINNIAERNSLIKILDPDRGIQNTYIRLKAEMEKSITLESEKQKIADYLSSKFLKSPDTEINFTELYTTHSNSIFSLEQSVKEKEKNLEDFFIKREDEISNINLKNQRLQSLKSELNFIDIQESINTHKHLISEYEKIFNEMKIKDAIKISKEEYITGLDTLKNIKEMIDNFRATQFNYIIEDSVSYLESNTDLLLLRSKLEQDKDNKEQALERFNKEYIQLCGKRDLLEVLKNRPKECTIDSCSFIANALPILSSNPNINQDIDAASNIISEISSEIKDLKTKIADIEQCISVVATIKIIMRNISSNKSILTKLPNGYIFLNTSTFLDKLKNNDRFNEIDDLYKFIDYANVFEQYKNAKDTLYKLQVDYKIYESKNEVIEELSKDIAKLEENLTSIVDTITATNDIIKSNKETLDILKEEIKDIETALSIQRQLQEISNNKNDIQTRLNTISGNMEKIQYNLNLNEKDKAELISINNEISPLIENRDSILYNIKMLKEYKTDFNRVSSSYNKIEVIKKYSSPTKNGIQNLFIKVYMNQTLKLANEMLSLFFDGRLILTNFIVDENMFSIPCYSSYSNMQVDDISRCSRSEKTMASLVISAALLRQSSTNYNIFKLDEIDEGLDAKNRLMYIQAVNVILDMLNIEQCIMVSHSSELGLGYVDVIKLRTTSNMVIGDEVNVIFTA